MPAYLLDSGILIRHLRNRVGFPELIKRLSQSGDLYILVVLAANHGLTRLRSRGKSVASRRFGKSSSCISSRSRPMANPP